jgi:hypothetical protein
MPPIAVTLVAEFPAFMSGAAEFRAEFGKIKRFGDRAAVHIGNNGRNPCGLGKGFKNVFQLMLFYQV